VQGVDPTSLQAGRGNLVEGRLQVQKQLLDSQTQRYTPIQVTKDGVIWDGNHGVRAAEAGKPVDARIVPGSIPGEGERNEFARNTQVDAMNCPNELSDVLLEVIRIGLLRIRLFATNGDATKCAQEADHIHNLPSLLTRFSADLLLFYWNTERVAFIEQNTPNDVEQFQVAWGSLADLLNHGQT
jgi:hypothetical protein